MWDGAIAAGNIRMEIILAAALVIGLLRSSSHSKNSFYQSLLTDSVTVAVLCYGYALLGLFTVDNPNNLRLTGEILSGFISGSLQFHYIKYLLL